jgi:hypothetical protein
LMLLELPVRDEDQATEGKGNGGEHPTMTKMSGSLGNLLALILFIDELPPGRALRGE